MEQISFSSSKFVSSTRIIYTPSAFAKSSLIHLQETGTLQALHPHKSERTGLNSCLFFTVLSGTGRLVYGGRAYELKAGDCVFIDCKKEYSHETGVYGSEHGGLWSLQWCHFYGPNMSAIYQKYRERGGRPVFRSRQLPCYRSVLSELYGIAASVDHVRDMRINEKLSYLLTLLMEDAWPSRGTPTAENEEEASPSSVNIQAVKEYLDNNFSQKISIGELSERFFINRYYLMELFKERYGITINSYLNQLRVTYIKQNLRFTNKSLETLASELKIEPAYLSRLFKKIEGVSPSEYRRQWNGKT